MDYISEVRKMNYRFTYPRDKYDEAGLDRNLIMKLIIKHQALIERLIRNKQYYDGNHKICSRERTSGAPNAKTVCNHAKDISDTATGYFMGNPITYSNTGDADIEPLLLAFDKANTDDTDSDIALNMSVYGVAYEYVYAKENDTTLMSKVLEPERTFIVYDDTIEENELFGVYYFYKKDDVNNTGIWVATICTEHLQYVINIQGSDMTAVTNEFKLVNEVPTQHFMGMMPIIEYQNNKDNIGDFEQQIGLIDAYDVLMADGVNDKEQFIDAILVLYGSYLSDEVSENETEDEEQSPNAVKRLRDLKLLELPEGAKAEYLSRTLDESGVEILRKAIKEDIYTFSHVPNLTDENFVGNSSGVAMEYKLLGLEMITKVKQRYYKKGLRKRYKLFCNYLSLSQILVDSDSIVANFTRGLPKNLLELAQTISSLKGTVSQKTLLSLLPFVEDPDEELEQVREDNAEAIKQQQELFNDPNADNSTPPEEDKDSDAVDEE